jgi:hypothetical protein
MVLFIVIHYMIISNYDNNDELCKAWYEEQQ